MDENVRAHLLVESWKFAYSNRFGLVCVLFSFFFSTYECVCVLRVSLLCEFCCLAAAFTRTSESVRFFKNIFPTSFPYC